MKDKKIVLIILIIILLFGMVLSLIFVKNKSKENQNTILKKEEINEEIKEGSDEKEETSQEHLEELIKETGKQGENDLYEVQEGENNIKVATIKGSIKYKVAFAGMIKGSMPYKEELDNVFDNNQPRKKGIWIYEKDRTKFLKYLSSVTLSKYSIDENGYLQIDNKNNQNDYDKKMEKAINGDKIYSITISSKCYIVDEITGEIQDYSFEDMDEYQTYEYFEDEEKMIICITENINKQLDDKEIMKSVIDLLYEKV